MRLVTYLHPAEEREQLAILVNDLLYDTHLLHRSLPDNMLEFLMGEDETMVLAKGLDAKIKQGELPKFKPQSLNKVPLLGPIPNPPTCRDAYAFRQHVEAGRRNRNLDMIPEFDQYPVFYFTNHHSIQGPALWNVCPIICINWILNWKWPPSSVIKVTM